MNSRLNLLEVADRSLFFCFYRLRVTNLSNECSLDAFTNGFRVTLPRSLLSAQLSLVVCDLGVHLKILLC